MIGIRSTTLARDGAVRGDGGRSVVEAFSNGFGDKPMTTFGTMNSDVLERTQPGYRRPNFCDLIAANPLGG